MKNKRLLPDISFWILIGLNGYLVYHYYKHPEIFITLIFLYWSQSVLLGLFNTLDTLTVKNSIPITFTANGTIKTIQNDAKYRRSSALFFIISYGILHLIYLLFLLSMKRDMPPIRWDFFQYFFFAFLVGQLINFIQRKIQQRNDPLYGGPMLLTTFIRVLPMHLTIVLSSFFSAQSIGIFLIFKSLADVGMYILTKPLIRNRQIDATAFATQNVDI